MTQESIISTLKAHNIESYADFKEFRAKKFQQTFGVSDLGQFLWTVVRQITLDTLYELSTKLWWKVPAMKPSEEVEEKASLWTTRESILSTLKAHNIENYTDLKNFGSVKFNQTFEKSDLGQFLWTVVRQITLNNLYELSQKLGWEVPAIKPSEEKSLWTTRESILPTLKAHNIENYTDLKNFGSVKFNQTFGKSDLRTFLGTTITYINLNNLYELSQKLGWEVPAIKPSEEKSLWTTQETILSTLKAHNIENYTDLRNFGPGKFKQTFGLSDLGTFFGTTFRTLTLDNLYDLAKKLGWEVPEIKPSEERKKK